MIDKMIEIQNEKANSQARKLLVSIISHEIGHFFLAKIHGFQIDNISIRAHSLSGSHTGSTSINTNRFLGSIEEIKNFLEARIKILYAGVLAESLFSDIHGKIDPAYACKLLQKGGADDAQKATEYIHLLRNILYTDNSDSEIATQLNNLSSQLWRETMYIISAHSSEILQTSTNLINSLSDIIINKEYLFQPNELENIIINTIEKRRKLIKKIPYFPIEQVSEIPQWSVVKYVKLNALKYFLVGSYSADRNGDTDKIEQILKTIDHSLDDLFSCAGIWPQGITTSPYGEVILVLKKNNIEKHTYVFNGDFQNLSHVPGEQSVSSYVTTMQLSFPSLSMHLEVMSKQKYNHLATRKERLMGDYFECRIFRPLFVEDIEAVYATNDILQKLEKYFQYPQTDDEDGLWNDLFSDSLSELPEL